MDIRIDPAEENFLLDHVVGGVPLLPTVMQLDLALRVVMAGGQWRRVVARDVGVGIPLTFASGRPRTVIVSTAPLAAGTAVTISSEAGTHLTAQLAEDVVPAASRVPRPSLRLTRGPAAVYPPFFHGPRFQVIGAAQERQPNGGSDGTPRVGRLAGHLPPLAWREGPTVSSPRLLELLLQCCGIADLDDGYGMRVPLGVDEVCWWRLPEEPAGSIAWVWPGPDPTGAGRTFDGEVTAPDGTLQLRVRGYRTTALPHDQHDHPRREVRA